MSVNRRAVLSSALLLAAGVARAADLDPALLARGLALADKTPNLRTLLVS